MIALLAARARSLVTRLAEAESALQKILTATVELRGNFDLLLTRLRLIKPPTTFVYVLGPPGTCMMAQHAVVWPGDSASVVFKPMAPLPKGVWVVAVGPALVRGVRVGNMMQSIFTDDHGQVCQTVDETPVGYNLYVQLEYPALPEPPF